MNKILIALVSALLIVFFGCSAMMDGVTPCYINEDIKDYTEEPLTSFLPYTTLWDANRLDRVMDFKYLINQKAYERLAEDEGYTYNFLKNDLLISKAGAQELQDTLFDPAGPIGLLLPLIGGGTLGALLLSKPGDKKKIAELEKNGNSTTV